MIRAQGLSTRNEEKVLARKNSVRAGTLVAAFFDRGGYSGWLARPSQSLGTREC
jgi:hypothetical protein